MKQRGRSGRRRSERAEKEGENKRGRGVGEECSKVTAPPLQPAPPVR